MVSSAAPTPIPAFAPVLRPLDGDAVAEAEEAAVVAADPEEVDPALDQVAPEEEAVVILDRGIKVAVVATDAPNEIVANKSGAGAWKISKVGFLQLALPVESGPQQFHCSLE